MSGVHRIVTREQILFEAQVYCRTKLGLHYTEALRYLDRGEFDGTIVETRLKMFRNMLG